MSNKIPASEVVFLLGAGTSVKAGVPDTFRFVKEFQQSMVNREDRKTVDKIIEILREWQNSDIDVELLLDTLTKLDAKEQEPILKFFEGGRFILSKYSEKRPIIEDLKDFIKRKAIIESQERIRYIEPLLGFVEQYKPLDIFSVNYDTCIEQFCNVYKLNYQDGFDVNWNPRVFEQENVDIRLYKLHGSIIWYRSDRSGYIKLPVMTEEAGIKLITGERAESLMLYPMQKFDYAEPLLELLIRFKNVMQNCKVLIVVGYSFRDAHIQRILLDAARQNRELTLIVVDPKASHTYQDKLKYFDTYSQIPSSLDGRVVCLPYKFEDILPYLKDQYLSQLRVGLSVVSNCTSGERIGNKVNWIDGLRPLASAEYTEKLQSLLEEKIDKTEFEKQWQLKIETLLKLSLNLVANGQEREAEKYLRELQETLHIILFDRFDIELARVQPSSARITFMFNRERTTSGGSYITIEIVRSFMRDQYQYLLSRSKMMGNATLTKKLGIIQRVLNYLEPLGHDGLDFDEFAETREKYKEELDSLRLRIKLWVGAESKEIRESSETKIKEEILKIEKKVIAQVFKINKTAAKTS